MINGEGIDRHLLGLKFIALENKIEVPELLRDEVHENTTYWKISTSQVIAMQEHYNITKTCGMHVFHMN